MDTRNDWLQILQSNCLMTLLEKALEIQESRNEFNVLSALNHIIYIFGFLQQNLLILNHQ
jgi:hypothetical protein